MKSCILAPHHQRKRFQEGFLSTFVISWSSFARFFFSLTFKDHLTFWNISSTAFFKIYIYFRFFCNKSTFLSEPGRNAELLFNSCLFKSLIMTGFFQLIFLFWVSLNEGKCRVCDTAICVFLFSTSGCCMYVVHHLMNSLIFLLSWVACPHPSPPHVSLPPLFIYNI